MPSATPTRSDVDALIAEFAWRVDHNDGHGVEDLFTIDGTYDMAGWAHTGRDQIRKFYDDRRAQGPRTSRHIFTGTRLYPQRAPDTANSMTVLTLHAHPGTPPLPLAPILIADYQDVMHRDDAGRWLFHRRTVTPLFLSTIDSTAH